MLGNRRLRQGELVDDVTAHPGILARQHPQDPYADRVSQRLGKEGELLVGGQVFDRRRQLVERLRTLGSATGGRLEACR